MRIIYEGCALHHRSTSLADFGTNLQATFDRSCRLIGSKLALRTMWLFIALVSIYDIWLVIAVEDVIFDSEQNPICLALIRFDSSYYSLFISAKLAGTLFVIAACQRIVQCRHDMGVGVTTGLASFQSGLLLYLSCG